MRALILTAMWPTPANPAFGSFVRTQALALADAGVEIDVLALDGRIRKLIYPRAVWQLRRRLHEHPADLVHAHFGYCGVIARTQREVPVVVTFHGDDVLGTVNEHGRLTRTSRAAAAVSRALAQHVAASIVQSDQMAASLRGKHMHVIPHEVDLDLFRPIDRADARTALGLDPDRPYVLFAASPAIPVKRFPLARDAVAEVRRRIPDVELLVVEKEPQDSLCLYMNACDVLAFSSYQEGSPNIIKQAMACNMPIVSTDVGDVRDLLHGAPGCHIAPAEVDGFARRLEALIKAGGRSRARNRVSHLSREQVAGRIIEVYREALGTQPAAEPIVSPSRPTPETASGSRS